MIQQHELALSESEEIAPLLEQFRNSYFNGEPIGEISNRVVAEYQKIIATTNNFFTKSQNTLMKTEIEPWVNALRDISESTILYSSCASFEIRQFR